MFQAPKEYKKALAAMDKDFVANIIAELKLGKKASAKFTSHIANGDATTQIEVSMK